MDISSLKEAGLTEGEIKVYLALLKFGSSTTGPIVEQSGVARSIIYQILEKLVQKGLASYVYKEKTKHYQAADPSRLLDYIDEREQQLLTNKKKVEGLLPLLLQQQAAAQEGEARIFEGFKGMISVHEHLFSRLTKGDDYFFLGIPQEQPAHYHAYWNRDHRRRAKAGISCRLLFHPKTDKKILANRNRFTLCDARYMPSRVNTPAWIMGYKDVAVIGFIAAQPITIEITRKEIADSFRAYFEEFWKKSKRFKR